MPEIRFRRFPRQLPCWSVFAWYTTWFLSLNLALEENRISVELAARAQQGGHVENQGHASVAEDRGAGNPGHLAEIRFQVLDHDLLLAGRAGGRRGRGL